MAAVAALLVAIGLIAACLTRWTHAHPLLIAAMGGVPGALIALWLPGETLDRASGAFVAIVYVIAAVPAAFGAFAGWLRRKNLERNI